MIDLSSRSNASNAILNTKPETVALTKMESPFRFIYLWYSMTQEKKYEVRFRSNRCYRTREEASQAAHRSFVSLPVRHSGPYLLILENHQHNADEHLTALSEMLKEEGRGCDIQ